MQIYVILIACVVLLLCLFFKVPVFISVFAGALVYFLFRCVLITGNLGAAYYFRNPEYTASCNPVFYMRRRFYELYRCDKRIMNFCNALTKR